MVRFTATAVVAALAASVVADSSPPSCGADEQCPQATPCCSQYGQCGTGAYCLGGCDPRYSFSLDSCTPAPVCVSKTYNWDNLDSVSPNTKYLGDASKADWVSSGTPLLSNGNLLLTMPPKSVGTLLANNHYMWYGHMSAKMKTSRGAGVVTAFILLSDVKDEIDWEFVGTELTTAQTNFYFQGILDYNNGANASVSDTFDNWHTYEVDWTTDHVQWIIDGNVVRTLNRASTWNATSNQYMFPQSPARVQLSLWPGGLATNAPGTVTWAGGPIDWNSPDIQQYGYDYATFGEVSLTCYSPPAGANVQGDISYIYTNAEGTNNTVEITNKPTVLSSFEATGTNMTAGASSSGTSTGTGTAAASTASDSIPGVNNGGSGSQGSAAANSGTSGSQTSSSSKPSTTGFSQGGGSGSSSATTERVAKGSFFAVLIAVVVLVTL